MPRPRRSPRLKTTRSNGGEEDAENFVEEVESSAVLEVQVSSPPAKRLRLGGANKKKNEEVDAASAAVSEDDDSEGDDDDDEEEEEEETTTYLFEGVEYSTYQDMVNAKRKRNERVLMDSGLLSLTAAAGRQERAAASQRGLAAARNKRQKTSRDAAAAAAPRRTSNRLAGVDSDGKYIEEEKAGRFSVGSEGRGGTRTSSTRYYNNEEEADEEPEFYRNRINDGAPLSVKQAVEHIDDKWMRDDSVASAERLVRQTLGPMLSSPLPSPARTGSSSKNKKQQPMLLQHQLNQLHADSPGCVAKVVPDRIYSIAAHPSPDQLIVCAGDKTGCVGIWNVDQDSSAADEKNATATSSNNSDGVHLFRFHKGAASCLQWTRDGSKLLSASYDGTVRLFDVQRESFEQVFGTYDSNVQHKAQLGYKMDTGSRFWTQYACLDHRSSSSSCFFLSTSVGTAAHVDLRTKGRVTFHEQLSEKKINSLSLHPNGHSLISAGLDRNVRLWDVRKFLDNRSGTTESRRGPTALGYYDCGKSVNSAFFSPSGRYTVATTQAHKLDVFVDFHLNGSSTKPTKPQRSIRHDNMTGRWLSTFMAQWHPSIDCFVVGSMSKPRCVEVFDGATGACTALRGDALTAVASRCCFHPSQDRLTIVGGNSSGRVTVIR